MLDLVIVARCEDTGTIWIGEKDEVPDLDECSSIQFNDKDDIEIFRCGMRAEEDDNGSVRIWDENGTLLLDVDEHLNSEEETDGKD